MIKETLRSKYLADAVIPSERGQGQIEWECPSNIALIKYWGKKPDQLPLNPSISFTLHECITRIWVEYDFSPKHKFSLEFMLDGQPNPLFKEKLIRYLKNVSSFLPFLRHCHLIIRSSNSFPHSAGIASSASSYAAAALALCSIELKLTGVECNTYDFFQKASFLARIGSGSACRSVFGGAVLWGETSDYPGSSDEVAIPLTQINPEFKFYKDSILIVHSGPKSVSSSAGHKLMENHIYGEGRLKQARNNLIRLLNAMNSGNMNEFISIIENEALSLHALMMSSDPGYILLQPNSLSIIESIRNYRRVTGYPVGFTLDAGANVHLLYPISIENEIKAYIKDQLFQYCEKGLIIHDQVGNGPVQKTYS